jgi:ribonuclease HII
VIPDLYELERELALRHGGPIAGVDEVGRGPLAGPVVAAAVILPRDSIVEGLGDSKTLTPARRQAVFLRVRETATAIGVGWTTSGRIDRLDILRATHRAMAAAVRRLSPVPVHLLVDGLPAKELPVPQTAVVKGDARCACVAAASVVAKVVRDRYMVRLAKSWPEYGFDRNMGYPTREHREALARRGPCRHHRMSFAPVRAVGSPRGSA